MSIRLSSSHLCLDGNLVDSFFDKDPLALIAFQSESNQLIIAPSTSSWFTKIHQAQQCLLKTKSMDGDKSIAIHSLLIDHEIDDTDRTLNYELNRKAGWIKVDLTN